MRTLRRGSKGPDVVELQNFLHVKADGLYGAVTEVAVKSLQRNLHIAVDGVFGSATAMAADFKLSPKSPHDKTPVNESTEAPMLYRTLSEIDGRLEKGTEAWNQAAYQIVRFDPGAEPSIVKATKALLANVKNYELLEKLRGIPWQLTGCIQSLECSSDPLGVLHNGERIIGTNKKTKLVPAGRGPFRTWIDAALDAVDNQSGWDQPNWRIGTILKMSEVWNGTGYLRFHRQENTPYNWAKTNINDGTGKYVSDGKWSEHAPSEQQVGVAALLKMLEQQGHFKPVYLI